MRGPFNAVATGAYKGATGQGRPVSRPKAATPIARAGERVKGANRHPCFTSARRRAFATIPCAMYSVHPSGQAATPPAADRLARASEAAVDPKGGATDPRRRTDHLTRDPVGLAPMRG